MVLDLRRRFDAYGSGFRDCCRAYICPHSQVGFTALLFLVQLHRPTTYPQKLDRSYVAASGPRPKSPDP